MRNVLVIAYYFPPLGMGGVQRTFKFCKYLSRFGWHPIVVTVKDIAYPAYDSTLLDEARFQVYRTESLDPLRLAWILGRRTFENSGRKWSNFLSWFMIPDNKSPWLPFMVTAAKALLRQQEISLIFATFPPTTSLVAGCFLKKICSKPLVVDLRDPLGYGLFPPTFLHSSVLEFLNRKIVEVADMIITVYPHSELSGIEHKVTVMPNGFDPEDFVESATPPNEFLIVHTGTLTKKRNGLPFLKSVKKLVESRRIDRQVVKVRLVGWVDPFYTLMIEKEGLSDIVELLPYASHTESVEHLMSSSLLWLPVGKGEIPGKVYEYLGSKKPIIATAPEGDCAELIRTTHSGTAVDPNDLSGISEALVDYYRLFLEGKLRLEGHEALQKFNRINQTRILANLFDEIAR